VSLLRGGRWTGGLPTRGRKVNHTCRAKEGAGALTLAWLAAAGKQQHSRLSLSQSDSDPALYLVSR